METLTMSPPGSGNPPLSDEFTSRSASEEVFNISAVFGSPVSIRVSQKGSEAHACVRVCLDTR